MYKITSISSQANNPGRVNVSINGEYGFSLELSQLLELGLCRGKEYDSDGLYELKKASQFGLIYSRALNFSLIRQRSLREMRDYLKRPRRQKNGQLRRISAATIDSVIERLVDKGYLDDAKFADFWVRSRQSSRRISCRKLVQELKQKGISQDLIDASLKKHGWSDSTILTEMIAKKRQHYQDDKKLMTYLQRLGFGFSEIKQALEENQEAVFDPSVCGDDFERNGLI